MKKLMCVAAAALLVVVTRPVAGQQIVSPYRFLDYDQMVGLFGGYVNLAKGEIDAGPHSGPVVGGRWAMRVSAPLSIGVEATFMPTKRTVRDTVFGSDSLYNELGESDVHLLAALANFRLNLMGPRTWNGLHPYLLLGGGVVIDLAPVGEAEVALGPNERFDLGTRFAVQGGAGIEYYPSQRFSAGVDVRNMVWKLKTPDAFLLSRRGAVLTGSRWEQNFLVSAGLSIHF